jgi:replicative DNA helicase
MTARAEHLEAEMSVLGGAMLEPEAADLALELLRPEDFAWPAHRSIFTAIESLRRQGAEADPLAVREELRRAGTFEQAGGSENLARIVDLVPTAANQRYWCDVLLRRRGVELIRSIERDFDRVRRERGFWAALSWMTDPARRAQWRMIELPAAKIPA